MAKYEEKTDQFLVFNSEGKSYTIVKSTEFIDAPSYDDPSRIMEGLNRYETLDGIPVNRINESEFEILDYETIRARLDPEP